jgi:hypothetical protein
MKIVRQNLIPLYTTCFFRLFLCDYTGFKGIGNSAIGVLICLIGRFQRHIALLLTCLFGQVLTMRKSLARPWTGVLLLFIFILSLLPRLTGVGRYITPDELIWVFRTVQFREAVLAGVLLLAFDPFVAGLSGILHVDALMATAATLALLTLLLAVDGSHRWRDTAVSGAIAALAVLSKTPAVLLVPLAGLVYVAAIWQAWRVGNGRFNRLNAGRVRQLFFSGLVWGIAALVTIVVAYPALWAVPGDVLGLLSGNAGRHIEEALRPSFFLGQVAFDHGPLFYPVVLLLRLSPVVLAGLIVSAFLLWRQRRETIWARRHVVLLFLWAVLYVGGISFAAKKFDRYALAVIPALIILAAVGWNRLAQLKPALRRYLAPLLIGIQALYLIVFLPYPLAAYNPLAGGPWLAQKALPLGWGEAVSSAGRWLAAQSGVEGKTAVTGIAPALAPFFPGQTLLSGPETIGQADYLIVTAGGRQGTDDEAAGRPANLTLLHTVHYGGLDQAWIYEQANPQKPNLALRDLAEPVFFGGRIGLLATQTAVHDGRLDVWLRWQLRDEGENGRYTIKLTLLDEAGHEWASREIELVNEVYFYPEFWAAGETPQPRYTLDLPPGLPSAPYEVAISLFDGSGAQQPLLADDGRFMGVTWNLPGLGIPAPAVTGLAVPQPAVGSWLDRLTTPDGQDHYILPVTLQVAAGE